jgi:mRNA-degrading endonuclease toxin of MazEF toxin-antitoxin module
MCKLSEMKHGAVFMCELPRNENVKHSQIGVRPVILASNNMNIKTSPCIHIIPISTRLDKCKGKGLPTHKKLHAEFLSRQSICLGEQLMMISKDTLLRGRYLGTLDSEDLETVKEALKIQLAL